MILNCSEQSEQRPRRRERPVRRTVPKAGLEVLFSRLRHGGGALMAKELPPCGPRGPPASRYNFCALHSRVPASLSSPPSFVPFFSAVQAYLAYALHVLALASRSPTTTLSTMQLSFVLSAVAMAVLSGVSVRAETHRIRFENK